MADFPHPKMRVVLWLYELANWLLLPVSLGYLIKRGLKDKLYSRHIAERFGIHTSTLKQGNPPVWIHAVSLGELRSAVPLIKALLDKDHTIVTTHYTPAGRTEAINTFKNEIEQGLLQVVYVPLELGFTFKNFYRRFQPIYGLVMEVEFWPRMIASARKHNIPLFLCNGQYPSKSYERDIKQFGGLRSQLVAGFAGVMVKSDIQAQRFASLGVDNIAITGELRFDQPIPKTHVEAGGTLRSTLLATAPRRIFTIASAIKGEDHIYIEAIANTVTHCKDQNLPPPLFVYVPRAPERFNEVGQLIEDAGLSIAKRSEHLDKNLSVVKDIVADVILGNSMGEMYFYLALADCAIVGGGFVSEKGAVLTHLSAPDELEPLLLNDTTLFSDTTKIDSFFSSQSGAIAKTLRAIPVLLGHDI